MSDTNPRLSLAQTIASTETPTGTHPAPVLPGNDRFLTAVLDINDLINSDRDLCFILATILDSALDLLHAEAGSLLVLDGDSRELVVGAASDIPKAAWPDIRIPIGSGIAGWVAEKRKPLLLVSGETPHDDGPGEHHRADVRDGMSVPLERSGALYGVLNLTNRRAGGEFTRDDLDLLATFGKQAAIAIHQARLNEERVAGYWGMVTSLARAVDARDPFTFGHSQSVRDHAVALAVLAGLSEELVADFGTGALLHDIGKIGVRDAILLKPGRLTDTEYEVVKTHPALGADILRPVLKRPIVIAAVRHHHERFDGCGYPDGLAGEAIPLTARVLAVADAYDAMSSTRNYRVALRPVDVLAELRKHRGKQFDPDLVDLFIEQFAVETGPALVREKVLDVVRDFLPKEEYEGYASFCLLGHQEDAGHTQSLAASAVELIQAQLDMVGARAGAETLVRLSVRLETFVREQEIPIRIDAKGKVGWSPLAGGAPQVVRALQTYEAFFKANLVRVTGFQTADLITQESLAEVGEPARTLYYQLFA
ncbi:MAG: GAF domain-containing protein [Actinobacteria bacterium]|nr:GAF domain-containing protein [Actinomycetota bacterium]